MVLRWTLCLLTALIYLQIVSSQGQVISIPIQEKQIYKPSEFRRFLQFQNNEDEENKKDISIKTNFLMTMYLIQIQLGKSEQSFNVLLDTGSFSLWITSSQCKECKKIYPNTYSCTKEDQCFLGGSDNIDSMEYVDGTFVSGRLGAAPMKIGSYQIKKQKFLYGEYIKNNKKRGEDGIFGLGIRETKNFSSKNWIVELQKSQQIPHQSFTIYFGFRNDSELTLGGYSSHYMKNSNSITYHQVIDESEWFIRLNVIEYGTFSTPSSTHSIVKALVDTGTTFIVLSDNLFQPFKDHVLANFNSEFSNNLLLVQCSDSLYLPDLVINMIDVDYIPRKYTIPPLYYLRHFDQGICYFQISSAKIPEDMVILGTIFFQRYVTVFSYLPLQIGFSESIAVPNELTSHSILEKNPSSSEDSFATIFYYIGFFFLFFIICKLIIVSYKRNKLREQIRNHILLSANTTNTSNIQVDQINQQIVTQ